MAKATSSSVAAQTGNRFYGAGGLVAIAAFFSNYVNFTGRSSRREFWWWTLWQYLVIGIFWVVAIATVGLSGFKADPEKFIPQLLGFLLVALLFGLAILLPSIAITIRRFRDAGVHWSVYVGLIVITSLGAIFLRNNDVLDSVVSLGVLLAKFVIEVLPTKNPPHDDDLESWVSA